MKTVLFAVLVLGVLGGVFGALLSFAERIFHVDKDPKVEQVRACLAGANCGGCGFAGCNAYAAAVAAGEAPTNKCVAGGDATAAKVAEVMGVPPLDLEEMVAFVPCSGCDGVAEKRFNYSGPQDCRAAMLFGGQSARTCTFACIGLGDCTKVCLFDAIHIVNGIAQVDKSSCVGCGHCASVCPKNIIKLLPLTQRVAPACSNKDKGAAVMKFCSAGCIGCGKCQRECPADAITVTDNLASIDSSKCVSCGHCADVCPRHIIKYWGGNENARR